ncbi:glutamyl-tRNA reductase [Paenibacillus sp.]|uniref:glutamyl-tRNA reductase n=1 Tax=Paenibacillus sp. TaxID=58172 RepID=UPI002D41D8EB|nr:glutamyl-tRNA reductase [Paenibacillus sp.]HZG87075.1 glutamyl-tRNA reductase [Paenibacillus sp.]
MHIVAIGLNYRTAPVEVRERFAVAQERLAQALREMKSWKSILECVIVATCNRTELYAVVDRDNRCPKHVRDFMEAWFGVSKDTFSPYLYTYEDDEAKRHLFRVACGLDSMVLGETQILGQVRDAFLLAQQERTTGTIFNKLFLQAITVAKRAHSDYGIGENAVSVSYAAIELGKRIFGSYRSKRVLIVGAGKMSELTVKHLHANGAERIAVTNRTLERAEELASKFGGRAYPFDRLPALLAEADVVISSTGSSQAILTRSDVEAAMKDRPSRPMFMIDIAVPRDLDPDIHAVQNVYLYDIDDLEGIVEANLEHRKQQSIQIEAMIEDELAAFDQWYRSLGVGPVIGALQEKAASIHRETMDSLRNKLPDLSERELKIIHKLTKSMMNQMMHDPIQRVKEMAPERRGDEALEYFTKLFALEEQLKPSAKPQAKPEPAEASDARLPLTQGTYAPA